MRKDTQDNTRLGVLKYKLRGYAPQQIADVLDIRVVEVHTYLREIQTMTRKDGLNLADISEAEVATVTTALKELIPYAEKSISKIASAANRLRPLSEDMLSNAELIQLCVKRLLEVEIVKETPDLSTIKVLSELNNASYKAFFNKEGIQVVNILNTQSAEDTETKEDRLLKLKAEFDAIDVDVEGV